MIDKFFSMLVDVLLIVMAIALTLVDKPFDTPLELWLTVIIVVKAIWVLKRMGYLEPDP